MSPGIALNIKKVIKLANINVNMAKPKRFPKYFSKCPTPFNNGNQNPLA
jgi:hypothetical protein